MIKIKRTPVSVPTHLRRKRFKDLIMDYSRTFCLIFRIQRFLNDLRNSRNSGTLLKNASMISTFLCKYERAKILLGTANTTYFGAKSPIHAAFLQGKTYRYTYT